MCLHVSDIVYTHMVFSFCKTTREAHLPHAQFIIFASSCSMHPYSIFLRPICHYKCEPATLRLCRCRCRCASRCIHIGVHCCIGGTSWSAVLCLLIFQFCFSVHHCGSPLTVVYSIVVVIVVVVVVVGVIGIFVCVAFAHSGLVISFGRAIHRNELS